MKVVIEKELVAMKFHLFLGLCEYKEI